MFSESVNGLLLKLRAQFFVHVLLRLLHTLGTRATGFISGSPVLTAALASGAASRTYSGLMHGADWLPTLASVAGGSA